MKKEKASTTVPTVATNQVFREQSERNTEHGTRNREQQKNKRKSEKNPCCIHCEGNRVKKDGHEPSGKQFYYCHKCNKRFVNDKEATWHWCDEEQRKQAVDLRKSEHTLKAIADILGVSKRTVQRLL